MALEHGDVLRLQGLELVIQRLVPGFEDEDLETQRRGGNDEVGEGDDAGEERHGGGSLSLLMWCEGYADCTL